MRRIFVTGSTDGLGRAAARVLIDEGHQVVLHARSIERAAAFGELVDDNGLAIGNTSARTAALTY